MVLSQSLVALIAGPGIAAAQLLAPQNVINLPPSGSATNPLRWLGANGPYAAGPNVNNIDPEVPENCHVDQAAYVTRHGSRYPDQGAYNGWLDLEARVSAKNGYSASGSLSFLPRWKTVLTNPALQIAMESPTGYKESYDLGYTLRTRYPQLYNEGDDLYVWSNNYTRVLQTASMFTRGFLGPRASTNGKVVSVTGKGFTSGIGDTLAPSDMCPNFQDSEGSTQQQQWTSIFLAPIKSRLQALVTGNLTLTDGDILQIPYLCGFESQITGRLSPWCGVFTDEELKSYEYYNDLRYYYGVGPGTDLPAKMMTPFLDALVGLLQRGPSIDGVKADGSSFRVPRLLASFLNDGQLNELVTASGVFDEQAPLDPKAKDDNRLFMVSRFSTMRGTFAIERLNCVVADNSNTTSTTMSTATRGPSTSATATTGGATTIGTTITRKVCPTGVARAARERALARRAGVSRNETYVRIRLNDAVYPIPSCKSGPGSSCLLDDYVKYVAKKYKAQGDWITNCNVTAEGAPTKVKGASFFTDLRSAWLQVIPPF